VRDSRRAFIGSFTSSGGRGIIVAEVDEATGALQERSVTDVVANPSFLALSPDGTVLYAVSEDDEGAAAAFSTNGAGTGADDEESWTLRLLGEQVPVCAAVPTHLTLAAGHLLTANYGSGSVTVLPLGPDGALLSASGIRQHDGSGPNPDRQGGPHAHQVLTDPTDRWVLSVDLGTDSVWISTLDTTSGTLSSHRETPLRPGSGPRHLAFHPAGDHVYVMNELDPTITVCRWDPLAGTLDPVRETRVLPDSVSVQSYASEVVPSMDGRFVWTANRGHDSISVLALDPSYEKPRLVTTVEYGGRWPRHLTLGPTGRHLYVSDEHSGDVTWFDIDPDTGVPSVAGSLTAPAASCVVFG
jgi:6-phosphogluconolactonase (cycloisomerase 2 family)